MVEIHMFHDISGRDLQLILRFWKPNVFCSKLIGNQNQNFKSDL